MYYILINLLLLQANDQTVFVNIDINILSFWSFLYLVVCKHDASTNIYINQFLFLNTCAIFIRLRGTLVALKLHICNVHKDGTRSSKRTKGLDGIIMGKWCYHWWTIIQTKSRIFLIMMKFSIFCLKKECN